MAEIWGMALLGGATLASGAMAADAAGDAADAANRGQNASIAEQRAAREQYQENITPYLEFGQQSMGQLNALNGGNYSGFMDSPDYLAALQGGTQAINRAAIGNLSGGGTAADLLSFGQRNAAGYLGNFRNALQFGTELGQRSAVGAGQLGQQSANNISNAYGQIGLNSGNAVVGQANAWGDTIGTLGNLAGSYFGTKSAYQQPQGGYGAFSPTNPPSSWDGGNAWANYGKAWGG